MLIESNNRLPEIAVIVPLYNTEKYIAECLKSIQEQSFENFICIVINDGSTDLSPAIAHKLSQSDPRFLVIDKVNGGVSSARNAGLDYLCQMKDRVQYVCFVDSDDVVEVEYLKDFVSLMNIYHADFAECGIASWYADGTKDCKGIDQDGDTLIKHDQIMEHIYALGKFEKADATSFIGLCNKCFRLDKIGKVRFDQELSYCEDQKFFFELYPSINTEAIIRKINYYYRMRASSATGNFKCQVVRILTDVKVYKQALSNSNDKFFNSCVASKLLNYLHASWRLSARDFPEYSRRLFDLLRENYFLFGKLCPYKIRKKFAKVFWGYRINSIYLHFRLKSSKRRHKKKPHKLITHPVFD